MKQSYSNLLRKMLIAIYQPIVTRIELFRATRMWQKGVKATIAKYKECGAPRFYMLYDQSHKDWAIMTYDPNRKCMLAYRRLVQMGKWKATRYFKNVEDIKAASYYYTPSKWGSHRLRCGQQGAHNQTKKLARILHVPSFYPDA